MIKNLNLFYSIKNTFLYNFERKKITNYSKLSHNYSKY